MIELEEGVYTITIEREGHEPYTVTVNLSPGDEKNVTVTLEPENLLEKALLSIDSHPDAAVFTNNTYRGETPLVVELEEGEYEVTIQKEGYKTYTEVINLSSGEKKNLSITLARTSRYRYYVLGLIVAVGLAGTIYIIKRSQQRQ